MICAAILHDVFDLSNDITPEIIDFNFGAYTTYLIQCITDTHSLSGNPLNSVDNLSLKSQVCNDDYLVILGAEHLDTIRCFDVDVTGNVLKYLEEISKTLIPLFENSQDHNIAYLKTELLKHRNKILG
jgi:(p)ppGpp synthase/HD superfamily hydrolase